MRTLIILISTFLVFSCVSAQFKAIQNCHPQCSWKCDDPKCDAICTPVCEPPKCHSSCQEPKNAVCDVKCEKPDCNIFCPDKACEGLDCPRCVTVCKAPHCVTHCQAPKPNCEAVCEEPKCDWKCHKPQCPKPKCELVCENPNCRPQTECCKCEEAGLSSDGKAYMNLMFFKETEKDQRCCECKAQNKDIVNIDAPKVKVNFNRYQKTVNGVPVATDGNSYVSQSQTQYSVQALDHPKRIGPSNTKCLNSGGPLFRWPYGVRGSCFQTFPMPSMWKTSWESAGLVEKQQFETQHSNSC